MNHYHNSIGLVVAKVSELQKNQNILYNLVKPKKDEPDLVESNLKLANVLPKKRIYRMSSSQELECFRKELLTRPLLLQCTIESGPGVGCFKQLSKYDCRFVQNSECYIVLLNQIHPKILSRLSMGLDLAVKYLRGSQPFILTFTFNKTIEKFYNSILRAYDIQMSRREKVSCNYAELTIRYLGNSSNIRITEGRKVKELKFSFEDLDKEDLLVDTLASAHARQRRSLPIDQGELVSVLKGWKFGDFEISDGLWNAYAEITGAPVQQNAYAKITGAPVQQNAYAKITGAPVQQNNCTPPPSYDNVIQNTISSINNSQKPDQHHQYQHMEYGYMDYSEVPSTSAAVVHPSHNVDIYENNMNMLPMARHVEKPTRKMIKPIENFPSDRGYAYSESGPVVDNIYSNYGYLNSQDNSPETQRELAAQELASKEAPNIRLDHQRNTSPGEGYEYGYISNHHDINIHTVSQQYPRQDVSESFI